MLSRMRNSKNLWNKSFILTKQLNNGEVSETFSLPKHMKVVVCGGGVMGASVAYHLAKLGWAADTILIEQGRFVFNYGFNVHRWTNFYSRIGGGTTWHSSGLIGTFKPSLAQVNLTKSSIQLYKELERKGLSTGWKQCGSVNIARTTDRMFVFRRMKAQSAYVFKFIYFKSIEYYHSELGIFNVNYSHQRSVSKNVLSLISKALKGDYGYQRMELEIHMTYANP